MGLQIGQRIGGVFEITEELPGIGVSEKYRAEVISGDVPGWMAQLFVKLFPSNVCGKVILDVLYSNLDALAKRSASGLQHLIQPIYVGQVEESLVLAYPHLKARSLADFRRVSQSKDAAHRLSVGLTQSVMSMHLLGVQHNRIAPSNVLLSRSSVGIERSICFVDVESVSVNGHVLIPRKQNESHYASPEQRNLEDCSDVGPPSDIYSLAKVLVDVLAGTNISDKIMMAADAVDLSMQSISSEWGGDVSDVLNAALNETPDRRPDASEVLAVLIGAKAGVGTNKGRNKFERGISWNDSPLAPRAGGDRIVPKPSYIERSGNEDGKARGTYVEIVASGSERFRRRYLTDQSLTDKDFTGSGAILPRGKLFDLLLADGIWNLKVTADHREISVDSKKMSSLETVRLLGETEIIISGSSFRVKLLSY